MAQYLAVGLVYDIITRCGRLKTDNISNEEFRQEIYKSMLIDTNLYDELDEGGYYGNLTLTLKQQVLETDLLPFLEAFYPLAYGDKGARHYEATLHRLRSVTPAEWLDLAKNDNNSAFMFDARPEPRRMIIEKEYERKIRVAFNNLMLYVADNQVVTEGIDGFFEFFNRSIREALKEHRLVNCVQVYLLN